MWSRYKTSGTKEHSTSTDVIKAVLAQLIERGDESSWAHVETVSNRGWFGNLLIGKEPWIEVAFVDAQRLNLNLGIAKSKRGSIPEIPWKQVDEDLWEVPVTELRTLVLWIDDCLVAVSGNQNCQVTGWVDGM